MLQNALGHRLETIQKVITVFQEFGFIKVLDSGSIYMTFIQTFIGKSSDIANKIVITFMEEL
jgi:hypothetical protein